VDAADEEHKELAAADEPLYSFQHVGQLYDASDYRSVVVEPNIVLPEALFGLDRLVVILV
jgi:hypothetical protein